jgi:hypothetical protein
MSTKFVCFINAHARKPILVNPDHVRTVRQSGSAQVTQVMDDGEGGGYQNVEGDLKITAARLVHGPSSLCAVNAPAIAPMPACPRERCTDRIFSARLSRSLCRGSTPRT